MALGVLFLLLTMLPASMSAMTVARETSDSLTVVFRFVPGKDMFFSPYDNNGSEFERLAAFVEQYREDIKSGSMPLYVNGHCSSAGSEKSNLAMAKVRSNRVKSELITRKGLTEQCFITRNHATGGDFVTVTASIKKDKDSDTKPVVEQSKEIPSHDTEVEVQTATEQPVKTDTGNAVSDDAQTISAASSASSDTPTLSLRANLLRWVTLTPDLGIEWHITPAWSVQVNGTWTSWQWDDKNRRYALWEVSPEVRYYMGGKKRGYVGAMYHVGQFNYKLGTTGKQGDLMGGGITGGYLLRLSKAFSLDFSIGLGYTHADYERYVVTDGVRVWQSDCEKNYWGVNHLGISLVWHIK